MKNIAANNASLFIMTEGGGRIPLGDAVDVKITEGHVDDCSNGSRDKIIGQMSTSGEISFTIDKHNKKKFIKAIWGITNNFYRIHGGFTLRERARYKALKNIMISVNKAPG